MHLKCHALSLLSTLVNQACWTNRAHVNTQIKYHHSGIPIFLWYLTCVEFDGFSHVFTYYAKQEKKKLYSRGCVIVCASSISGEKFPPLLKYSTREQGQWISHVFLCIHLFFSIIHTRNKTPCIWTASLKIK